MASKEAGGNGLLSDVYNSQLLEYRSPLMDEVRLIGTLNREMQKLAVNLLPAPEV